MFCLLHAFLGCINRSFCVVTKFVTRVTKFVTRRVKCRDLTDWNVLYNAKLCGVLKKLPEHVRSAAIPSSRVDSAAPDPKNRCHKNLWQPKSALWKKKLVVWKIRKTCPEVRGCCVWRQVRKSWLPVASALARDEGFGTSRLRQLYAPLVFTWSEQSGAYL